jgi:anthranilate/para-aminobenzoate synthase component I
MVHRTLGGTGRQRHRGEQLMSTLNQACALLRTLDERQAGGAHYIFHLPRRRKTYAGFGVQRLIRYFPDGVRIEDAQGRTQHRPLPAEPLLALKELVDPRYPAFLLVGADLERRARDPDLPLLVCAQPQYEAEFSAYGDDATAGAPLQNAPATGWETQPDQAFCDRVAIAIGALRQRTFGKMIMTRPYQKPVPGRDRLALFELFAASEPAAAASHFLQIDPRLHSLGCSPENIFEVGGGQISFDVVAATRGISPDPSVDREWLEALTADPKERREHQMAFDRYQARIETLIEAGSLRVERKMDVLQLGNVRHLYSKLAGRLRPGLDWARMLADSYPPLMSYPADLHPLADVPDEPNRFYGGVVGRIAPQDGPAALFLNLRACLIKGSMLYTLGGVGVIAESEPAKELLEVKNKLSGLMKAIAAWEQGA